MTESIVEMYQRVEAERNGLRKSDAEGKRKVARLSRHIAELVNKMENLRYEVRRLEDTLAWTHRKLAPHAHEPREDEFPAEAEVSKVVDVIEQTIPRRLARKVGDAQTPGGNEEA